MRLFLITPYTIDKDFDKKKEIVKEVLKKHNIELILGEDSLTKGSLSAEKTIRLFDKTDFFIADLSYERPSCYYEIGFLQAKKKDINFIAKKDETIHQLLDRKQIEYYSDLSDYKELIVKIVRKLTMCHT